MKLSTILEDVTIIWIDASIDESQSDSQNTLRLLRTLIDTINLFRDETECIEFLRSLSTDKNFIITSGALGQNLVEKIHDIQHIDHIYIFCSNVEWHSQWSSKWKKVRGVHKSIQPICEGIQATISQWMENTVSFSFTHENHLETSFLYPSVLKETLSQVDHEIECKGDLLDFCRSQYNEHPRELKLIDEFDETYKSDKALWWYTRRCFLFELVNKALESFDKYITIYLSFFMYDVEQQIRTLHRKQFDDHSNSSFTVYRGQCLSNEIFEQIRQHRQKYMRFHNFLSATKEKNEAIKSTQRCLKGEDMVGVIFIFTVDSHAACTTFVDIENHGYVNIKEEIIFSMDVIFRIDHIQILENSTEFYEIQLSLVSNDDSKLELLNNEMNDKDVGDRQKWMLLGNFLMKTGHIHETEDLYRYLIKQSRIQSDQAFYNHCMGKCKEKQGDVEEAIRYYEQEIEIFKDIPSMTDIHLIDCYKKMVVLYYDMMNFEKALSYCKEVLEILEKKHSQNDLDLASTYNCMGTIFYYLRKNTDALHFYGKALEIREKHASKDDPYLATCYNNIAVVYDDMNYYSKALSYYQKALEIDQHRFSPKSALLAAAHNNIGGIYFCSKEYRKALASFQKALAIAENEDPTIAEKSRQWIQQLEKNNLT